MDYIFLSRRALNYTTELILKRYYLFQVAEAESQRQTLLRSFHLEHAANYRIFIATQAC